MIRILAPFAVLVCACSSGTASEATSGGTEPEVQAVERVEVEPAEPVEPAQAAETATLAQPEDDASYESLATRLEPTPPPPNEARTLQAAVDACPPPRGRDREARLDWFDTCQLGSALAHTQDGSRWVGLSVDYGEGGPESFRLWEQDRGRERDVLQAEVSPAEVGTLRRRVRSYRQLVAARNIVRAIATTQFSLNEYAPLVELGAPLEGWRLWIETTDDLDQPEHVAWLISAEGERHEVDRRVAEMGACDGGGFWCEQTESECEEAGLRAENRLCVLPVGIGVVAMAGETLALLGGVQVAGHGGYPPFHWIMRVPESLR